MSALPFWERKTLSEMTTEEWESLCDGCAKCCRHQLEEIDTGKIFPTRVACQLLDTHTCRCSDYTDRHRTVPDCICLTPARVAAYAWLPKSCAYRRIHEGRGLAEWHPLRSGSADSVHEAGISMRGQLISEQDLPPGANLEDYLEEKAWT